METSSNKFNLRSYSKKKIPYEERSGLRSYSINWPEGVVVLIPREDKFKLRSYLSYWPEEVAVLIPHEDRFKVRSYSLSFVKILFNVLARGGWQF